MTRYNLCLLSGLLRHIFLKTADIRVHILGNRSRRGPKSFSNRGHRGWPFGRPVLGPPLDRVRSVPYVLLPIRTAGFVLAIVPMQKTVVVKFLLAELVGFTGEDRGQEDDLILVTLQRDSTEDVGEPA